MRAILLAGLMLTAGLAGCLGSDEGAPEPTTGRPGLNPWQAGLLDHHPTPEVAERRSAEERRADVAEPGDPAFARFDAAMEVWMETHNISAGQLALMKGGKLRYERGYGTTDRAGSQPTHEATMFRIASLTKPLTAALVSMQVEQGLYNWTDPVFCLPPEPAPGCRLPIQAHPVNPVEDARLADVQVQHLIDHTGGWDGELNWMQLGHGAIQVARELRVPSPPSAWRTAQYLMGEPLVHEPGGGQDPYCNLCYMLAGLVAEAATGAALGALYDAYLFRPLEIQDDIQPGATRPEERDPREPFYACEPDNGTRQAPNVFEPNETACPADGRWSMRTQLAQGGLIATAAAVAAVYETYAEHTDTYEDRAGDVWRWFTGSNPGTRSASFVLAQEDAPAGRVQFVFLFNSREPGEHCRPGPQVEHQPPPPGCQRPDDLIDQLVALTKSWGTVEETSPGQA